MRLLRKFGMACLLLCMLPLIGGCWDRTEVNDLGLIMAAGLDLAENGNVELSVQVFTPNQSSGEGGSNSLMGGGSGGNNSIIVQSATGTDFADAAAKLQEQMSRKVFWGHGEVFIFGEKLARQGILNQMDFIFRHLQPRERAYVFVSKGDAKEILKIIPKVERDVAETLREMAILSFGMGVSLKDLSEMLTGRSKAAVVPLVDKKEEPEGNTFPYITGAAVIKDGKLTGTFGDKVKRETLLIRNKLKRTNVTFPVSGNRGKDEGMMTAQIVKGRTALIPVIRGRSWSIIVRFDGEASILQNETRVNVTKPQELRGVEEQLNKEIEKRVAETFRLIQRETGADIFGASDAFWRKYPKVWLKEQRRWDEIFPNVNVRTESRVKILSPGFSGKSYKEGGTR